MTAAAAVGEAAARVSRAPKAIISMSVIEPATLILCRHSHRSSASANLLNSRTMFGGAKSLTFGAPAQTGKE
jgi:hypothetical protein